MSEDPAGPLGPGERGPLQQRRQSYRQAQQLKPVKVNPSVITYPYSTEGYLYLFSKYRSESRYLKNISKC